MIRTDTLIARIAMYLFFAAPAAGTFILSYHHFMEINEMFIVLTFFITVGFCAAVIALVNRAFPE